VDNFQCINPSKTTGICTSWGLSAANMSPDDLYKYDLKKKPTCLLNFEPTYIQSETF